MKRISICNFGVFENLIQLKLRHIDATHSGVISRDEFYIYISNIEWLHHQMKWQNYREH